MNRVAINLLVTKMTQLIVGKLSHVVREGLSHVIICTFLIFFFFAQESRSKIRFLLGKDQAKKFKDVDLFFELDKR